MGMNVRQQKYKANRIKGMSAYKAAREAGYSHATAVRAYQNIEKRINFDEVLLRAGLTDELIGEVMYDGLTATRTLVNGEKKPERMVRHRYLETYLKLSGKLKGDSVTLNNNRIIVVNMPAIKAGERELEYNIGSIDTSEDSWYPS